MPEFLTASSEEAMITILVEAANCGLMITLAKLCGAQTEYDLYAGICDPPHEQLVLGWNGPAEAWINDVGDNGA
jgi:hypothetical protein